MHVLVCLADRPGEVVSRDALLQAVWGDSIVGEEAITVAISELRRILKDNTKSPHYIETIRKGGYRLITEVRHAEADQPPPRTAEVNARPRTVPPAFDKREVSKSRPWLIWAPAIILAILSIAIIQQWRKGPPAEPAILKGRPFTSYPGNEMYPALSPDGKQVAFVWAGEDGDNYDIYVKQLDTETPLRLTDNPADESYPAWSPDGNTIAFVRYGERAGIYIKPVLGGSERRLSFIENSVGGLDWSPDGRWIAFSAAADPKEPYLIALLSLETMEIKYLTFIQEEFTCDSWPAFSPDGKTIAFIRAGYSAQRDIFLIPTGGGTERRLTRFQHSIQGLDWTSDGRSLVIAAAPSGHFSLWRVTIDNGALAWLPTHSATVANPSIAVKGAGLVFEEHIFDCNIWRVPMTHPDACGVSGPFISSTRTDCQARYSQDGGRIAFISSRSGSREIWICDADGKRPRQLTNFNGAFIMEPRWSPDGNRLAFTAMPEGNASVYIMEIDSSLPKLLTHDNHNETRPFWSSDGEHLYFTREDAGRWQIWKMDQEGKSRVLVTDDGIEAFKESEDGLYLYYWRPLDFCICRLSLIDGERTCYTDGKVLSNWNCYTPTPKGVYSIQRKPGYSLLVFYDYSTCQTDSILALNEKRYIDIDISPDGQYLLYSGNEKYERDLILVEDFR